MRPPGPLEIGLILLIILIVFGVGKLPQVGTALGKSIAGFRKASRGEDEDAEEDVKKPVKRKTRKAAKTPAGAKDSTPELLAKPAPPARVDTSEVIAEAAPAAKVDTKEVMAKPASPSRPVTSEDEEASENS